MCLYIRFALADYERMKYSQTMSTMSMSNEIQLILSDFFLPEKWAIPLAGATTLFGLENTRLAVRKSVERDVVNHMEDLRYFKGIIRDWKLNGVRCGLQ